jgi:hypothetical protein
VSPVKIATIRGYSGAFLGAEKQKLRAYFRGRSDYRDAGPSAPGIEDAASICASSLSSKKFHNLHT